MNYLIHNSAIPYEVDEKYKIGDVFSIPGHIGWAVNEAMFGGLPIVMLGGKHPPEVYYMKQGVTGYFAKDEEDFKSYMLELLRDDAKRKKMSEATLKVFDEEVSIDRMYQGFIDAVIYTENNKKC
jgi:glycosyltransferase involved in cell wall biosynthesis